VGFGRFGRAIADVLEREGIEWTAFDPRIAADADPRLLQGDYTESTLRDAGIAAADVLVAGSDIDTVNLGATTLARRVRPDIFVIIRRTRCRIGWSSRPRGPQVLCNRSSWAECLQCEDPMLGRFIAKLARAIRDLVRDVERIRRESGEGAPRAWTFDATCCSPDSSMHSSACGRGVRIGISWPIDVSDERLRRRRDAGTRSSTILLQEDDTQLKRAIASCSSATTRHAACNFATSPTRHGRGSAEAGPPDWSSAGGRCAIAARDGYPQFL
jgi:hypothetical protein